MSLKHLHSRNTARYAEQTVSRTALGSLLLSQDQVVIPLFQRPYCWTESQLETWMTNIVEGVTPLAARQYRTGNVLDELRKGRMIECEKYLMFHH